MSDECNGYSLWHSSDATFRYDFTATAIFPVTSEYQWSATYVCVLVSVGVCFCLWLALAFFFSICNFHSWPSHLNFARLKGRQANLLRIYRLCKLQKFSNENFNYYAAFEGKLCSNNTVTTTAGECFKCISSSAAARRFNVAVTETNVLPAACCQWQRARMLQIMRILRIRHVANSLTCCMCCALGLE